MTKNVVVLPLSNVLGRIDEGRVYFLILNEIRKPKSAKPSTARGGVTKPFVTCGDNDCSQGGL